MVTTYPQAHKSYRNQEPGLQVLQVQLVWGDCTQNRVLVLKLQHLHSVSPRHLLKTENWAPCTGVLIQSVHIKTRELAFRTGSQVVLVLLVPVL